MTRLFCGLPMQPQVRRRRLTPMLQASFPHPSDLQLEFRGAGCADLLAMVTTRAIQLDRAFSVCGGEARTEQADEQLLTLHFTHPHGAGALQSLEADVQRWSRESELLAPRFQADASLAFELFALVPDEPGMLARLSRIIGDEGFHICTFDGPAEAQREEQEAEFAMTFDGAGPFFSLWFDLRFFGPAFAAPDLRAALERADPRFRIRFRPRLSPPRAGFDFGHAARN